MVRYLNISTRMKTKIDNGELMIPFLHPSTGVSPNDVITLDATTYGTAIVRDADLLLKFHAPWCTFCVEHRPIYDEVAAQFREVRTSSSAYQRIIFVLFSCIELLGFMFQFISELISSYCRSPRCKFFSFTQFIFCLTTVEW